MKNYHITSVLVALALILSACRSPQPAAIPTETVGPLPTSVPTEIQAPVPTAAPTATTAPPPTEAPTPTEAPAVSQWIEPVPAEADLSRSPVTSDEQASREALAATDFIPQDPIALAIAIKGVPGPVDPVVATEPPTLNVGTRQEFWVHNTDTNQWSRIEARLLAISEHAYFWFDTTRDPKQENIDAAVAAFEDIYQRDRDVYGSEWSPGIDGDPRVYILHPSALATCNVREETAHQCTLLGYYSTVDELPAAVDPHSNEHEMFVMVIDTAIPGSERYRDVLGHEFRHMIEYNYDRHDDDWEVEGSAMMAEYLLGFERDPLVRGSQFVGQPDLQLNAWSQGASVIARYGQGYVFNRYFYDRFGPEMYTQWMQHPDRAFFAIDDVLAINDAGLTAEDVWLDWLVTLVIHDDPAAPEPYTFAGDFELPTAAMDTLNRFPAEVEEEVHQYAVDYYSLRSDQDLTVSFTGSTKTLVANTLPASGAFYWYSGRANGSDMHLTREVDLTGVSSATLQYAVYHAIEKGYDFAYLLASTDGGATWESLVAENMQGEDPADDPGEAALSERFYTGNSKQWIEETVDLTPYAGQKILLRFQYITDAIFTHGGFAVDNVAVPEIGFSDDAETLEPGWTAQGFSRVTAYIPQRFILQLVTFENGIPTVQRIELADDNTATFDVTGFGEDNNRAILIVAAEAPLSLMTAHYAISVEQR